MPRASAARQKDDDGSTTTALLRAYRVRGDTAARERLIELYLPLVEPFARRYAVGSDTYDDLYQVGCIGLINAIDRFDPQRGAELAAFAVPNIAGEIRRYLRDRGDTVRVPRRVQELRASAQRAHQQLAAQAGRDPSVADVARSLGADEQDVALAIASGRAPVADAPASGRRDVKDAALDAAEARLFLSAAAQGLDERQRRILYLRYVLDLEVSVVAEDLGISARQVSRDTQQALSKLRSALEGRSPAPGREAPEAPPAPSQQSAATARRDDRRTAAAGARQPRRSSGRSGQLLVRLPQSLHTQLAREARRHEMSLNRYIMSALEAAVRASAPPPRRPQGMMRAVTAAVVIVATLGLALVVLGFIR